MLLKKPKKKTIIILLAVAAILLIALTAYIIHENKNVQITEITVTSSKLPSSFDGYRIAHISDLHSTEFGENNRVLLKMLSQAKPDMIVLTGDLYDYRWGDMSVCIEFCNASTAIAPTYMVSGNHDEITKHDDDYTFSVLEAKLRAVGVTVLRGDHVELEKDGDNITLIGIDDISILRKEVYDEDYVLSDDEWTSLISNEISPLLNDDNSYTILLSHRPEYFDTYVSYGVDLVFCGHAHGGQFRLPLIEGLYAPGQGIFPKYTSGLHTLDSTNMIVSRGLGNSGFPFRFNNPPEIVIATLKCE